MLIPFGILSAAGAGGAVATPSYELIETIILTSNQNSITFSNLGTYSSTYKHLQIRAIMRSNRGAQYASAALRINGDSGANYSNHEIFSDSNGILSGGAGGLTEIGFAGNLLTAGSYEANAFTGMTIDFLDSYSTSKNKTVRHFGGVSGNGWRNRFGSGAWFSTSSITSISIRDTDGTSLIPGTRFSIYGIRG